MKLRYAMPLALLGWYLSTRIGSTVPKDCPECGVGGAGYEYGGPPFKTKADCEKAGRQEVQDFYADAKKRGEQVLDPTSFVCLERKEP
jgi:hypothetical protein